MDERRVRFTADDFGLCGAVNEGVERAHREGLLDGASLMVAGEAAADAAARARAMPGLAVGLHLVVIEGKATLPRSEIPDLVDARGWFSSDQLRLGMRYVRPRVQVQLAAEIRAQFAAFAATGLRLAHADAHKHMHLHPVVGRLMVTIGREFGLDTVRVPREPADVLAKCGHRAGPCDRMLAAWSGVLRGQVARAGMRAPDAVFGIAWSGHMTPPRLLALAQHLPAGESEIYLHPAARRDALIAELMPEYEQEAELAALLDPEVIGAFRAIGWGPAPGSR